MKIGLDLDGTIYKYPDFFREFIRILKSHGHKIYCVSNHFLDDWADDCVKLSNLGIDPNMLCPDLMQGSPKDRGARNKARMADRCDLVFDDDADKFRHLTKTPVVAYEELLGHLKEG